MHSRKLDGYKIKVVVQIIVSLNERSVYDHKFMIVIHDGVWDCLWSYDEEWGYNIDVRQVETGDW